MNTQISNAITEIVGNYVEPADLTLFQSKNDMSDPRIGDYLFTYNDSEASIKKINAVLLSMPQDLGVARNGGRIGAAKAPEAIKKVLYKLTPFCGTENFFDRIGLFDAGTIKTDNLTLEESQAIQENVVSALLSEGYYPIIIGGGHEIGYPNGAALGCSFDSIGILNFDAHTDVRPLIDNRLGHSGSPFRQIIERKDVNIEGTSFVEFGIQPFAAAESHCDYIKRIGGKIISYAEIRKNGFETSFDNALARISENTEALYISFDIDAVSSAFAPGVSAPAIIGFTADEFLLAAQKAGTHNKARLVDFVEMNPMYDSDNRTAKLVALGIASYLSGLSKRF